MSKGAEGERFLSAFGKLKDAVDDNPARLEAEWKDGDDRSIIENFLLLRLLIEQAPEDLTAHGRSKS